MLREADRLLRREARGSVYPWEVDHRLVELCADAAAGDVAALVGHLLPMHRERLRESLTRFPATDEGWEQLAWVSGSVGVAVVQARTREEFVRLEGQRMGAELD